MTTDPAELESRLAHDRANAQAMPDEELARLHRAVVGATRGAPVRPRERLAQLPTPVRAALALTGALGLGALTLAVTGPRDDLPAGQAPRLLGSLIGVCGLALLLLPVPILLGMVPTWWAGRELPPADRMQAHVACFITGTFVAAAAASFTLLFDRSDRVSRWRVLAAAAGGGLASFATLGFHCYVGGMAHLALAHGLGGIVTAGVLLLVMERRAPATT